MQIKFKSGQMTRQKRIGIYASSFDPVHLGHITFALQAAETARLDEVIFVPERRPQKTDALAHFGHRTAMISRAIRPYPHFYLLELPDIYFSPEKTLPKLRQSFRGAQLVLMKSSDDYKDFKNQPDILNLAGKCELIIGTQPSQKLPEQIQNDKFLTSRIKLIEEILPPPNTDKIRSSMLTGHPANGLLASVRSYAAQNWLYASLVNIT